MSQTMRAKIALSCLFAWGGVNGASAQEPSSSAPIPASTVAVSTVDFQGLFYVNEADIRARCQIEDNRLYSQADLFAIDQCLRRSGVFAQHVLEQRGTDLTISVTEMESRPGRIEFGLSYNTTENIIGSFYAERYNLINGFLGQAEITYSSQRLFAGGELYRQSLLGENWGLGFSTGLERTRLDDQPFEMRRGQAEVFLRYDSFEQIQFDFGIGMRSLEVRNLRADASPVLQGDAGVERRPFVRLGLKYQLSPTDMITRFGARIDGYAWNLGGNRLYELQTAIGSKLALGSSAYSVLINADAGAVFAQGDDATRIVDRFSLTSGQLRGFAARGIGPRDGTQFLGGDRYATARVELQRDFGEVFDTPVTAGVFANAGSVWGLEDSLIAGTQVDDSRIWRASAGITVSATFGSVPLSMYVATPLRRVSGDKTQAFGLNISTRF